MPINVDVVIAAPAASDTKKTPRPKRPRKDATTPVAPRNTETPAQREKEMDHDR